MFGFISSIFNIWSKPYNMAPGPIIASLWSVELIRSSSVRKGSSCITTTTIAEKRNHSPVNLKWQLTGIQKGLDFTSWCLDARFLRRVMQIAYSISFEILLHVSGVL